MAASPSEGQAGLEDITNRGGPAGRRGKERPLATFSRKQKRPNHPSALASDADAQSPIGQLGQERDSCQPEAGRREGPQEAQHQGADVAAKPPARCGRGVRGRRAPPSKQQQEALTHDAFVARMKQHFAEVDAFELTVESPQASPQPPPADAFGVPCRQASPHAAGNAPAPAGEGQSGAAAGKAAGGLAAAESGAPGPGVKAVGPSPSARRSRRSAWGLSHRVSAGVAPAAADGERGPGPAAGAPQPAPAPAGLLGRLSARISLGLSDALQRLSLAPAAALRAAPLPLTVCRGAAEPGSPELPRPLATRPTSPSPSCHLKVAASAGFEAAAGAAPLASELAAGERGGGAASPAAAHGGLPREDSPGAAGGMPTRSAMRRARLESAAWDEDDGSMSAAEELLLGTPPGANSRLPCGPALADQQEPSGLGLSSICTGGAVSASPAEEPRPSAAATSPASPAVDQVTSATCCTQPRTTSFADAAVRLTLQPPSTECKEAPPLASALPLSGSKRRETKVDARAAAVGRDAAAEAAARTPLQELLVLCKQEAEEGALPGMDALLLRHISTDLADIRKVGEGTFGEAFRAGGLVLKVMPIGGAVPVNGESQKGPGDVAAEARISLALSGLRAGVLGGEGSNGGPRPAHASAGFVAVRGAGVCAGRYSCALVAAWRAWDAAHGSENQPVDGLPHDQMYAVLFAADGGEDLERFAVRGAAEARSILLQATLALAVGEAALEFEHRDLHWGNLLVRRSPDHRAAFHRLRGVDIEVDAGGLGVALIDFTLSRLCPPSSPAVVFFDLGSDPELFQGPRGDCQADTYRRMRKATQGHWEVHCPATNALWLHYLADVLLQFKLPAAAAADKRALRDFRKRAAVAGSAGDLVADDYFRGAWRIV